MAALKSLPALLRTLILALHTLLARLLPPTFHPRIALPTPTGPYSIGLIDRDLHDPARDRRLMVSIWYPAQPAAPGVMPPPVTPFPAEVAKGVAALFNVPALLFEQIRFIRTHATQNAPLATSDSPFPVLVFSHGLGGLRLQNTSLLQELASWGYIIVALDHPFSAAVTVFPDGETARFDLTRYSVPKRGTAPDVEIDRTLDQHVFPIWVADQRFVYDLLAQWNESDPHFAARLDLTRMASFGHSFGGATSFEVCRLDPRCRAALNMDGGLYGGIIEQPCPRPLFLFCAPITATTYADRTHWPTLATLPHATVFQAQLPGSNHYTFTDTGLIAPSIASSGLDTPAALRTIAAYVRAFFDVHLRQQPSDLWSRIPHTTAVEWVLPAPKPSPKSHPVTDPTT